jgi:DNA-binding XRE family transcriptional regulator
MKHRHLEIPPGTKAKELPSAAIADLLKSGDLADWKQIAEAIARDPNGELAERVMSLVDAYPMYGTSPLWRAWIDRARARSEGALRPLLPAELSALRRRLGLTQAELAGRIGMSQSDLSKLERRKDVRLSTLKAHAMALGGRLRIVFEHDGKQTEVRLQNEGD